MKTDKYKTAVVFFKEKDGSIMAYFPDDVFDSQGNRASFAHIGQHSACSPAYVEKLPITTSEEAKALKKELESIGYNLEILTTKKTFAVDYNYRTISGNPSTKKSYVEAFTGGEANEILRQRVMKYKRFWKGDGGSAVEATVAGLKF